MDEGLAILRLDKIRNMDELRERLKQLAVPDTIVTVVDGETPICGLISVQHVGAFLKNRIVSNLSKGSALGETVIGE